MILNELMSPDALEPLLMAGEFSPNSRFYTFLKGTPEKPSQLALWAFDLETKTTRSLVDISQLGSLEGPLSDEEKARRERLRLFVSGITHYEWSPKDESLLLFAGGGVYWRSKTGAMDTAVSSGAMDARFSPRGHFVSWVSGRNLHLWNVQTKVEEPLTNHGGGAISVGSAEFVVEEELQRFEGYWWSEDEAYIAFEEFDESGVDIIKRNEIYADRIETVEQRYPAAGKANVTWKLGVLDLKSRSTQWIPLDTQVDHDESYLARAAWDHGNFFFMTLNRQQTKAQVFRFDPKTKELKKIIEEISLPWFNLMEKIRFTPSGDLVMVSERSGFAGVYIYSREGELKKSLVFDSESVLKIIQIFDDSIDLVLATKDGMGHMAKRYSLKDSRCLQVFSDPKAVATGSSTKDKRWVAVQQTFTHLPQKVEILDLETGSRHLVSESPVKPHILKEITDPEFGSLKVKDYTLYFRMIKPKDFSPSKKYPAIAYVYGGPHAQKVNYGWQGMYYLYAQYLAAQGFVVFTLDNRGSAHRGKAFEADIAKAFGSADLEDQVHGAKYLQTLPFVDKDRLGIYGWSYGGYMTLMAMCKAPDLFKVGSSGAPVTDWCFYDTAYTERYLGLPQLEADTYKKASVFTWVDGLKGKLQLIHGMADDNVLYVNSTMLYSELQKRGKQFEIQAYPGEKHALASNPMRVHCYASITRFFKDNL
jgi:dipeptidyl-peptidase-4